MTPDIDWKVRVRARSSVERTELIRGGFGGRGSSEIRPNNCSHRQEGAGHADFDPLQLKLHDFLRTIEVALITKR
jgi:hypothetical protein